MSEKESEEIMKIKDVVSAGEISTNNMVEFRVSHYPKNLEKFVEDCENKVILALNDSKKNYQKLITNIKNKLSGEYSDKDDMIENEMWLVLKEEGFIEDLKIVYEQSMNLNGKSTETIALESLGGMPVIKLMIEDTKAKERYDNPLDKTIGENWVLGEIKYTRSEITQIINEAKKPNKKPSPKL